MIWRFFYSFIVLPVLWAVFHVLALVDSKVRRGLRGRKTVLSDLREFRRRNPEAQVLWVHASSMGEFEQAKPIIEALKARMPHIKVVASFFSPSGLENNRRYIHADMVTYLPLDTKKNATSFLDALKPAVAAFIRYDVWPQYIWQCEARGIPVLLTNATMRKNTKRLLPGLRRFHQMVFSPLKHILTVSQNDTGQFLRFGLDASRILPIGDTRYDRVLFKAATAREKKLLPQSVVENKLVVVFGSSWQEDEDVFLPPLMRILAQRKDILAIVVPHEPTVEHLEQLEYRFRNGIRHIRFSAITAYNGEEVIFVDSIGILLSLYASADIAFVGGGFKSNVHNTLEPAAYGIPVIYGPKIFNSQEARELADAGGGVIVSNKRDFFRAILRLINLTEYRNRTGQIAGSFVRERGGATARILEYLLPFFERR